MVDPVLCADGITYERQAITLWFQAANISPVTGQPLYHKNLTPNDRAREAIQAFQQARRAPSPVPELGSTAPTELPHGWQPMSSGGFPVYVSSSSGEISHERPFSPGSHSGSAPPIFNSRNGTAAFKNRAPMQYQPIWEWENDHGTGYNEFDPAVVSVA